MLTGRHRKAHQWKRWWVFSCLEQPKITMSNAATREEICLTGLVSEAIRAPEDFLVTYTVEGPTLTRIGSEFSLCITTAEFDRIRTAMDSY